MAQTIYKQTPSSILDKVDNYYMCQGEKYILKNDYNVGEDVDLVLYSLVNRLDEIISSGACLSQSTEKIVEKLNLILTHNGMQGR